MTFLVALGTGDFGFIGLVDALQTIIVESSTFIAINIGKRHTVIASTAVLRVVFLLTFPVNE